MRSKSCSTDRRVFRLSKMQTRIMSGFVTMLLSYAAHSAELREVSIDREVDRYTFESTTWFDASPSDLYKVLIDYDQFEKFTTAFVETYNREPDEEGRPRYYTRMEGCVLLFCKTFVRSGHLVLKPETEIVAVADPAKSNFKLSKERWELEEEGEGTLLRYHFEMIPDFWVPPVIGPFVIKRALRSGGTDAVDRIEAIAQGHKPKR